MLAKISCNPSGNVVIENGVPVKDKKFGADVPNCDDDRIGARVTFFNNDSSPEKNWCIRDLEDFNRLQMNMDPLFGDIAEVEFTLQGAPINLFEAVDVNLDYITQESIAKNQARKKCLFRVDDNANPNQTSVFAKSHFRFDGNITPFIWEARGAQNASDATCELILSVKIGGILIGSRKVLLLLRDTSRFYDYIASIHSSNSNPIDNIVVPSQWSQTNQSPDDYILIVHGFNVDEECKKYWPGTAFKRLWWQGFRGRVGFLAWDCVLASNLELVTHPQRYDESDYRAWQMGQHLAPMLSSLRHKVSRLHLLAHSQGNVVAGEALRLLPLSDKIQTYIASQAAISCDCYNSNAPEYKSSHDNPNVIGVFPGWNGSKPYLEAAKDKAENKYSFNNKDDYALVSVPFGSWENNNSMKPDMGFSYEGSKTTYDENGSPPSKFFVWSQTDANGVVHYDEDGNIIYQKDIKHFPNAGSNCEVQDVVDTHLIFSFIAESWATALGVNGVNGFTSYDLQLLGFNNRHYSHSRQFRSDITKERHYWEQVLVKCGIIQ